MAQFAALAGLDYRHSQTGPSPLNTGQFMISLLKYYALKTNRKYYKSGKNNATL